MNGQLHRRCGHRRTFLQLDGRYRTRLRKFTREAKFILRTQDQKLWSTAAGPDFLGQILGGVLILERIGNHTEDTFILEDDSAHLAFMAACALALVASHLGIKFRRTLRETLELVAMCCPVELERLPDLHALPSQLRDRADIRRLLQEPYTGRRELMLSDGLILFNEFKKLPLSKFSAALSELAEVTEGFRTAREKLRGALS